MYNLSVIFIFIAAKILLLKSIVLAATSPYIGLTLASAISALVLILGIIAAAALFLAVIVGAVFLLYYAIMATIYAIRIIVKAITIISLLFVKIGAYALALSIIAFAALGYVVMVAARCVIDIIVKVIFVIFGVDILMMQKASNHLSKYLHALYSTSCSAIEGIMRFIEKVTFMISLQIDSYPLNHASDNIKADKKMMLAAVKLNGSWLQSASDDLKRDPEIVRAAIEECGAALQYAGDEFKRDPEMVRAAIAQGSYALMYANEDIQRELIKEDKYRLGSASEEIQIEIVKKDLTLIEYPSYRIQRKIIAEEPKALQYADIFLKRDWEVVLGSIAKYGWLIEFVGNDLKNNASIVSIARQTYRSTLRCASNATQKEIIAIHPTTLKDASSEVQKEIVSRHPERLPDASSKVQKEIIAADGMMIRFASDDCKKNAEIVLVAVAQNIAALEYASIDISSVNKVMAAVRAKPKLLKSVTGGLFAGVSVASVTQTLLQESIFAKIFFRQSDFYIKARAFIQILSPAAILQTLSDANCINNILKFLFPQSIPEKMMLVEYIRGPAIIKPSVAPEVVMQPKSASSGAAAHPISRI